MNSRDKNFTSVNYHMFSNNIVSWNTVLQYSTRSNLNISVKYTENAEQPANTHVLTRKV